MYDYGEEETREQVLQLLRFPGIGPLPVAAIAINLGLDEDRLKPIVEAMVTDRLLAQDADERLRPMEAARP